MHIRTFTDADYDQVLALTLEVFGPFWEDSLRPAVGDTIFLAQDGGWADDYRRHLHEIHDPEQRRFTLVAEDDDTGEPVGYVACLTHPGKPAAEVDILAVRAGHRQTGVATALCAAAFALMREAGSTVVVLGTGGDDFHAPARRFYESLGMTPFPNVFYYREL